ncbi:phage resistance protein [Actinomadura keratinilytica]|uniref:Phage resistance protein n=1 Tax=Actinomadura keratinilytica TaxID=547461 RepID=A0ABP7ZEP9_9ACTN
MTTLLRDLIDIPERVHSGDMVLKLSGGIADRQTVAQYVVTPQLADSFDRALGIVQSAVETGTSHAAYIDGSFGSGKSHFMAMLHALISQDPDARGKKHLREVADKHDHWLEGRKILMVPFLFGGTAPLAAQLLGQYVKYVTKLRPDVSPPPVYRDALLLENARELRRVMGDEAFLAGLPNDPKWGSTTWTPQALDEAMAAPPGDTQRQNLVADLLASHLKAYRTAVGGDADAFVSLDEGLSLISRHAKEKLGYDAIILLLDELVLWLNTHLAKPAFVAEQASMVSRLVESAEWERPAPIISFVPRQRDLRDLVNRDVAGAQQTSLFDTLKHWDGRFDFIRLADANLPEIVRERLLKPKDDAARAEIEAAFDRITRMKGQVWEMLLDAQGGPADLKSFRATYPFSPAFLHAMVDISSALQRERTALKLMLQLLVDHRDTLPSGKLVPLGAIFDVLLGGGVDPFSDKLRTEFDKAKNFYVEKLRPWLLARHKLDEERAAQAPAAFRGDDLVVKTLMLKALVPNVPALQSLTPDRLAALNHGWIPSMLPGRQGEVVHKTLRDLASEFGEIRLHGQSNPTVDVALIGVDTEAILRDARNVEDDAAKRRLLKRMLWEELKAGDDEPFVSRRTVVWRGTTRVVELVFANVADPKTSADVFAPEEPGALRVIIDYPFDNIYGPAEDRRRVEELQADPRRANSKTLCWLPSFLSHDRLVDLGDLVVINHVLERDRLHELTPLMSNEDRERARDQLKSRQSALTTRMREVLRKAYGLASHDDADIGKQVDQHIMGLDAAIDIRPPAALGFDAALEHICGKLLDHLYPKHPDFAAPGKPAPYRPKDLQVALSAVEKAVENDPPRYEPPRSEIPTLRRIINPLGLGVMGEAAVVLNDTWPMALDRLAAQRQLHGDISVAQLRDMVAEEQPGLPPDVVNLVISAYALMRARAWVRRDQVVPQPDLKNIPGDIVLRPQALPSPEEFEAADRRAADIFQLSRQQVRSPRSVHALADALRRKAGLLLPHTGILVAELERHADLLGLDGSEQEERLTTARVVHELVEALVGKEDTELLESLARFDLRGLDPVVCKVSLRDAQAVADALVAADWPLLGRLPDLAESGGDRAERARLTLDRLRSVARRDEQVARLAGALTEAKNAVVAMLADSAPAAPVPPPGPGAAGMRPTPGAAPPPPPFKVHGEARVLVDGLDQVVERIRKDMAEHPDMEFEITWRSAE